MPQPFPRIAALLATCAVLITCAPPAPAATPTPTPTQTPARDIFGSPPNFPVVIPVKLPASVAKLTATCTMTQPGAQPWVQNMGVVNLTSPPQTAISLDITPTLSWFLLSANSTPAPQVYLTWSCTLVATNASGAALLSPVNTSGGSLNVLHWSNNTTLGIYNGDTQPTMTGAPTIVFTART